MKLIAKALKINVATFRHQLDNPLRFTLGEVITLALNIGETPEAVLRLLFGTPCADYSFFEQLESD